MKTNSTKLNCVVVDDDALSRSVLRNFIKKTDYLHLSEEFENPIFAHQYLQQDLLVDILFLDIEMPEMSGLELLQVLDNKKIQVIFTTSRDKYAVQAFEYDVKDYLLKPITYTRFLKAVSKVVDVINEEFGTTLSSVLETNYIFVRANHKIIKIDHKEIFFVEALSDYVVIHTAKNKYVVHSTMKAIEERLDMFKKFARIHRSYIINTEHIESIQDAQVIIHHKSIPIGRSYRNRFINGLDVL